MLSRVSSLASRAGTRVRSVAAATINPKVVGAFGAGAICAMPAFEGQEFFHHKFVTNKDPDAIVDFYSTEDFLQILGIFPFAIHFILAGVQWDTTKENTMEVHNAMEISFTLEEKEETTDAGETVVGFFQKRERFKNYIPFTKFVMWDQVQCYGYNRREDGSSEVFHRGEYFMGPYPIRLLCILHSYYVIWATERHINSPLFATKDLEAQEHQRSNIPVYALSDFVGRLSTAYSVAMEAGKVAAGKSPEEAARTLKTLKRLQESPTTAYVETLRSANLKRTVSRIQVDDVEAQKAIDAAFASLSKTSVGQQSAAAAMSAVVDDPQVKIQMEKPRYGGAYRLKGVKGMLEE